MLTLSPKDIHLWLSDEREVTDSELTGQYLKLLNTEELARYNRFVFPQHRHRFLVTRALVRSVLGEYQDTWTPDQIIFGHNGYGKPHLHGDGHRLQFNLSHTEGLIVMGVVLDHDIGVDVESDVRSTDIMKLAARYFSPQEFRGMQDLTSKKAQERFFDLWTLKESYIKACGEGLRIPLEEFSFSVEADTLSVGFSPQRNDDPANWRFWQIDPGQGYKLALAIRGADLAGYKVKVFRVVPLQGFKEFTPVIDRTSA